MSDCRSLEGVSHTRWPAIRQKRAADTRLAVRNQRLCGNLGALTRNGGKCARRRIVNAHVIRIERAEDDPVVRKYGTARVLIVRSPVGGDIDDAERFGGAVEDADCPVPHEDRRVKVPACRSTVGGWRERGVVPIYARACEGLALAQLTRRWRAQSRRCLHTPQRWSSSSCCR